MPITPERVTKLRTYGLSEYASRTYLALLDLGTAEARDISGISKVPASKIYRILEQLHEKGLVDILPEFPRKYAPVPFSDFLDKLHQEHKEAAGKIAREREALARMFAVMGDVESSDRGGFTVVRGRRNVLEKLDELSNGARRSLFLLATPGLLRREGYLADLLDPVEERGGRVQLLLRSNGEADARAIDARLAGVGDVRHLPDEEFPLGGAVALADGERALIIHFVPDDGHAYEGNDVAVSTDQPGIVSMLEALVAWPWRDAAPATAAEPPEDQEDGMPPEARREVPVMQDARPPESDDDASPATGFSAAALPEKDVGLARF